MSGDSSCPHEITYITYITYMAQRDSSGLPCYIREDLIENHEHQPNELCCTELIARSVAMFCYVFPGELRGPAWAVGSYSVSQ